MNHDATENGGVHKVFPTHDTLRRLLSREIRFAVGQHLPNQWEGIQEEKKWGMEEKLRLRSKATWLETIFLPTLFLFSSAPQKPNWPRIFSAKQMKWYLCYMFCCARMGHPRREKYTQTDRVRKKIPRKNGKKENINTSQEITKRQEQKTNSVPCKLGQCTCTNSALTHVKWCASWRGSDEFQTERAKDVSKYGYR